MVKYKAGCCGSIMESTSRHDFVRCRCGRSFLDGGDVYNRIGWTPPDDPPELVTCDPAN